MSSEMPILTDDRDKLELVKWLIERHDNLRASIANRAAIVLSADALLITAVTLLSEAALPFSNVSYSSSERILLVVGVGLAIVLLVFSMICATTSIVNVWQTSRQMLGPEIPIRLFFNARDTLVRCSDYNSFVGEFKNSSLEQALSYSLAELWTTQNIYRQRYSLLRLAIRFMLGAAVPFVIVVFTVLTN